MAKVTRRIWGGIVAYDEDDTPADIRLFNKVGKSPDLWLYQSRALYQSAIDLVEERTRKRNDVTYPLRAPIALMLGAYSIETLLKMVIVAAHCDEHGYTFDSRLAEQFLPKSHDLVALTKQAKLRVNESDRRLLRDLRKYSVWAGRYPIPLFSDGYSGPALFEAVAGATAAGEHPTWPGFKILYLKLFKAAERKTYRWSKYVVKAAAQ